MKNIIIRQLDKLINNYIKLDPYVAVLMQPLVDKTVALSLAEFPGDIYFHFQPAGKIKLSATAANTDVTIKGSLVSLANLALSSEKAAIMGQGKVKIQGDMEVAEHFQKFWQSLHIDWEGQIANWVGDPLANLLSKGGKMLQRVVRHTQHTLTQNLAEYIHEEIRYFPPREEVANLMNDIDTLRLDEERLAARIARLQQHYGTFTG
jgi:ubiquinone biosynthesis protein UbiJ